MTIADLPMSLGARPQDATSGCDGCCGAGDCASASCGSSADEKSTVAPGFDTALAMAEAAASHNRAWWNEIRTHVDDPEAGEYCSSLLLAALLESSAHRLGIPVADVWGHIRRTGELPL